MKINLIIPAKGTSERLKNKNLCEVNGKSLIRLACEKCLKCDNISELYLDTESDLIINQVLDLQKERLKIIRRPKELANNNTDANEMMIYSLHSVSECDIIAQTFVTSPLISSETIDTCIEKFINKSNSYDSFFTINSIQRYFWDEIGPINFSVEELPNSFELKKIYVETHGLYGIKTNTLIKKKTRIGYNPLMIEIPQLESFDINYLEDIEIVRKIMS